MTWEPNTGGTTWTRKWHTGDDNNYMNDFVCHVYFPDEGWNWTPRSVLSHVNSNGETCPLLSTADDTARILYYPVPIPVKSDVTLWFGTEDPAISYGLYDIDTLEPIVECSSDLNNNGTNRQVNVDGYTLFFPNNITVSSDASANEHWFRLKITDSWVSCETGGRDGISPIQTENIDGLDMYLDRLCYVGIKQDFTNNRRWTDQKAWGERVRIYWNPVGNNAQITTDKSVFWYSEDITGTLKVNPEMGEIPIEDITFTCKEIGTGATLTNNVEIVSSNGNTHKFKISNVTPRTQNKYQITAKFNGDDTYEAFNVSCDVEYHQNSKITDSTTYKDKYYTNNKLNFTVQLRVSDGSNWIVGTYNAQLKIYKGTTLLKTQTITGNNSTYTSFNYTPTEEGTYKFAITYPISPADKTVNVSTYEKILQVGVVEDTSLSLNIYSSNDLNTPSGSKVYYPNTPVIKATLSDTKGNLLNNLPIKFYLDNTLKSTVTTDNNGIATLNLTNLATKTKTPYTIKAEFVGNEDYHPSSTPDGRAFYYWHQPTITIDSSVKNKTYYVKQDAPVKCTLTDANNNPLSNKIIKIKHDINGGITSSMATTDSNGKINATVSNQSAGAVVSTVELSYEGDTSLLSCSDSFTIIWKKIKPTLECIMGLDSLECRQTNSLQFKLTGQGEDRMNGIPIQVVSTFTELNGTPITYPEEYTKTITTNAEGVAGHSYNAPIGDIKQNLKLTSTETDIYESATLNHSFIWERIETLLEYDDITTYSGRYTLIEEGADLDPSPGTNPDYNNFRAKVVPKNHPEVFRVDKGTIAWKGGNTVLVDCTVNSEGEAFARYTDTTTANKIKKLVFIEYSGTNVFKPVQNVMEWTILKRVDVSIPMEIIHLHNPPLRYNIPFKVETTLLEGDEALSGKPVEYWFEDSAVDRLLERKTTGSDGKILWRDYRPQMVGDAKLHFKFNAEDTIDKYNPIDKEYIEYIDLDNTLLMFINLPKTITEACGHQTIDVQAVLFNSIMERIEVDSIFWYENFGDSANGNVYEIAEVPDGYSSTENGIAKYTIYAWSPIKKIKAEMPGTWCYYPSSCIDFLYYKLEELMGWDENLPIGNGQTIKDKYGSQTLYEVKDGYVEIPIGCKIPDGLYDLKVEYIGSIEDDCSKYAPKTIYKGIRKKQQSQFTLIPNVYYVQDRERFEVETEYLLDVTTQLKNITRDYLMTNTQVITRIDELNGNYDTTDENALVTINYASDVVDSDTDYTFIYEQTRKIAGTTYTTSSHTFLYKAVYSYIIKGNDYFNLEKLKRVPELSDIIVLDQPYDYEVYAREKNKYTRYYIERSGYDPLEITKASYDYATTILCYENNNIPIHIKAYRLRVGEYVPINLGDIVWRDGSGDILGTAITNVDGEAVLDSYHRSTIDKVKIHFGLENDPNYEYTSMDLYLDTKVRRAVTVTNNLTEVEKGYNSIYHVPVTLNATFTDAQNGNPLKYYSVRVKMGGELYSEEQTDENGTIFFGYTPQTGTDYKYQVIMNAADSYAKADKTFTVKNTKMLPIVTITTDKKSYMVTDKIKYTVTIKESDNTTPIANVPLRIVLKNSSGTQINIATVTSNSNGTATLSQAYAIGGSYTPMVVFDGNSYYKATSAESSQGAIGVAKLGTQITGENEYVMWVRTSTTITCKLVDENGKGLDGRKLTVQYGNTTTNYTTTLGSISWTHNATSAGVTTYIVTFAETNEYSESTLEIDVISKKRTTSLAFYEDSKVSGDGYTVDKSKNLIVANAFLKIGIMSQLQDISKADSTDNKSISNVPISIEWEHGNTNEVLSMNTDVNGITSQIMQGQLHEKHRLRFVFEGNDYYEPSSTEKMEVSFQRTKAWMYRHNTSVFSTGVNLPIDIKTIYLDINGNERGIAGALLKFVSALHASKEYDEIPTSGEGVWGTATTNSNGIASVSHKWTGGYQAAISTKYPFNTIETGDLASYFTTSIYYALKAKTTFNEDGISREQLHYQPDYYYAEQEGKNITCFKPVDITGGTEINYGLIACSRMYRLTGNCTCSYDFKITSSDSKWGVTFGLSKTIGRWTTSADTPLLIQYTNSDGKFKVNNQEKNFKLALNKNYTITVVIENSVIKSCVVGGTTFSLNVDVSSYFSSFVGLKFFAFCSHGSADKTKLILTDTYMKKT